MLKRYLLTPWRQLAATLLEFLQPFTLSLDLAVALLLMGAYWYLAVPGNRGLGRLEPGFASATGRVVMSVLLLWRLPLLYLRYVPLAGYQPPRWGWGDVRFGVPVTLLASVLVLLLLALGSSDPDLQATYPWAGAQLGRSALTLLLGLLLRVAYNIAFEFFFRGFLLQRLQAHWNLSAAVWFQTMASALLHVGTPVAEFVSSIPAGLLFAALALRGRSLLYPVALHVVIGFGMEVLSLWQQGLL